MGGAGKERRRRRWRRGRGRIREQAVTHVDARALAAERLVPARREVLGVLLEQEAIQL